MFIGDAPQQWTEVYTFNSIVVIYLFLKNSKINK